MLQNAYLLAKFNFDTAENELAKNLQNFACCNPPIGQRLRETVPPRCLSLPCCLRHLLPRDNEFSGGCDFACADRTKRDPLPAGLASLENSPRVEKADSQGVGTASAGRPKRRSSRLPQTAMAKRGAAALLRSFFLFFGATLERATPKRPSILRSSAECSQNL